MGLRHLMSLGVSLSLVSMSTALVVGYHPSTATGAPVNATASARLFAQDQPCYTYIIPPPECADETSASYGFSNDQYYNAVAFPYPSTFVFGGMINGHEVWGTAYRSGTSSAYNGSFDADDFSGCYGTVLIDVTTAEALLLEAGGLTSLSSWRAAA